MQISQIRMKNFKGRTRIVPISRLTVIGGPNDVGKTATLQALQVAILGYDPALGPKETASLRSASEMSAGVTIMDGTFALSIDRSFYEDGTSIRQEVTFDPPVRAKSLTDQNEHIRKTLGDCVTMLDTGKFKAMTPGERAAFLTELIQRQGGEITGTTDFFAKIQSDLGDLTPEVVDPIIARAMTAWNPQASIVANVDAVVVKLATMAKEAADAMKTATEAVRSISGDIRTVGAGAKTVAELRIDVEGLRASASHLRTTMATNNERSASYRRAKETLDRAVLDIMAAEKRINELEAEVAPATTARDAAATAANETQGPPPQPVDPTDHDGRKALRALEDRLAELKRDFKEASKAVDALNASEVTFARKSECPVVTGVTCPAADSIGEAFDAKRLPFRTRMNEISTLIAALEPEIAMKRTEVETAEATLKAKNEAVRTEIIARQDRARTLNETLRAAESKLSGLTASLNEARKALEAATKRRDDAEKVTTDMPPVLDTETMDAQIKTLDTQITAAEAALEKAVRVNELNDQKLKKERAAVMAEAMTIGYRKALGAAKKHAGAAIAKSLEPVTRTMDDLLSAMRTGWKLVVEPEGNGVVFRADTGSGSPIPWKSLGGGLGVIFTAVLALALGRLASPKLKCLILDAAEVDPENMDILLTVLAQMGGDLDNIIVASCHVNRVPAPWSLVTLRREEVAV